MVTTMMNFEPFAQRLVPTGSVVCVNQVSLEIDLPLSERLLAIPEEQSE